MGTYFSIPYIPKRAATVEVSAVKSETPASVPTLVAADLKTEAEPKIRIPLTDMETAITKEVDQILDQKREPDENKKAIQGLLIMVEDMQKIIEPKVEEPKVEKKVEPKEEPKIEEKKVEKKEEVNEEKKVEKKEEVNEEKKVEKKEEKKVEVKEEPKVEKKEPTEEEKKEEEKKEEPKEKEKKEEEKKEEPKKGEYKEALKDLLREAQIPKEPSLPVIMEEPPMERKLSITIPSSSPIDPPRIPEMNKKKKNKK